MTENTAGLDYRKTLEAIAPLDGKAFEEAQKHMDSLIKPLGSLGKLEDIAVRIAGMTGKVYHE